MRPVIVLIFHAPPSAAAGALGRALAESRLAVAEWQRGAFLEAGADEATIVAGRGDGQTFGQRLSAEVAAAAPGGVVILGSGSAVLARPADLRLFVEAAAGPPGQALANNRYSADVVAVSRPADLLDLPPLPADNALPRWLEERAGVSVRDLAARWRLGIDLDSPADMLLVQRGGGRWAGAGAERGGGTGRGRESGRGVVGDGLAPVERLAGRWSERVAELAEVLADRRAELLVAGRVSTATLAWLQRGVRCRVRAIVEERGLRASSPLALGDEPSGAASRRRRPPRSLLGALLDRDGPEGLGAAMAGLADAAVVDSRVLLAHRCGVDEAAWPGAEDRFASDLLLAGSIADPWLGALTHSAADAPLPVVLGGHTLVNAGLRLIAASRPRRGPDR